MGHRAQLGSQAHLQAGQSGSERPDSPGWPDTPGDVRKVSDLTLNVHARFRLRQAGHSGCAEHSGWIRADTPAQAASAQLQLQGSWVDAAEVRT